MSRNPKERMIDSISALTRIESLIRTDYADALAQELAKARLESIGISHGSHRQRGMGILSGAPLRRPPGSSSRRIRARGGKVTGPEFNPRDDEQDEEEQFVFAIAEMVQEGKVTMAKIHLRSYIDHVNKLSQESDSSK